MKLSIRTVASTAVVAVGARWGSSCAVLATAMQQNFGLVDIPKLRYHDRALPVPEGR